METKRQAQIGELIKRNFGYVLQQEGPYIYGYDALVTVTSVRMSPDLLLAKLYLSIYNIENKEAVIALLDHHKHQLKQSLVQRIKKHVRRIPRIEFYEDNTLDEMEKLNKLFDNLNKDS